MTHARRATTRADRLTALRVAHAATRPEQPFEVYAGLRLRSPLRRDADWWLLEDERGVPVTSLMGYALELADDGGRHAGLGIGAVATHPEHRGLHHASTLCAHAIRDAEAKGRPLALLFSAIPPALYERLGFVAAPAHAWRATELDALADGPVAELSPVDGMREAATLAPLYEAWQVGLHPFRDAEAFARSAGRGYEDIFFTLGDPVRGYVRLHLEAPGTLEITELIVPPEDERAVLAWIFQLARRTEHAAVAGWMPPSPTIESAFRKGDRSKTLPMVRGPVAPAPSTFWSSDYF